MTTQARKNRRATDPDVQRRKQELAQCAAVSTTIDNVLDVYLQKGSNDAVDLCHQMFGRYSFENVIRQRLHNHSIKIALMLAIRDCMLAKSGVSACDQNVKPSV